MTNQEMNLIQTIRESNNPNALAIATTIIISHLKRQPQFGTSPNKMPKRNYDRQQ